MKQNILAIVVIANLVILASCSKDTDNASKWVGTYASTGTVYDNINQVTITEVNSNAIKILLQYDTLGIVYTYDTIQNATLSSATSVTFNETDYVHITPGGQYLVAGQGTLGGNNLTISGTAINNALNPPQIVYSFTGSK